MEKVNHPSHYNIPHRKECIVEMEEKYGIQKTAIFCLLNSYKYLYRAGMKDKNTYNEDIQKAKWYFDWCEQKRKENKWMYIGSENLYNDIKKELAKYD